MRSAEPFRPVCRVASLAALATVASIAVLQDSSFAAAPRVHAIVGARVVTAPGRVIDRGTVVMRDGLIVAVGANVAVPADARVWKGDSLTVYPGLIDPFVPQEAPASSSTTAPAGRPSPAPSTPARGATHELTAVRPETRVVETLTVSDTQLETLRGAGFTVAQFVPRSGIFRGTSAVVGLGRFDPNGSVLVADAAQVVSLETARNTYPGSLMGGIAVVRQGLLDARWYRDAWASYDKKAGKPRPETNLSWAALRPVVEGQRPALFVAHDMLEVLRAAAIAKEGGVKGAIVGGGDEYKRVKEIVATTMPLVVPVNYPETPEVGDDALALEVTTEELRHWNQAPGNAAALAKAGATFSFTANGLKDTKTFRSSVTRAIRRGLTRDQALAAVTTAPAALLGLSSRLGTIEAGKIANLTVMRGDLFSDAGKVREVWVDGARYEVEKDEPKWAGTWRSADGRTLVVAAEKETTVKIVTGSDTTLVRGVILEGARLRFTVPRGTAGENWDVRTRYDQFAGNVGDRPVTGTRGVDGKSADTGDDTVIPAPVVMGNTEGWRNPVPSKPSAVLVRGATIWTSGPQGVLRDADLLVRDGKITAVGTGLKAPSGATVVDGAGKHVAPGIIDAHSHSAIVGNVNECTNSITAEVRIADVVNSESVNIYRQLAGGTTIMHLLHGSCNAIGGQCAVIKNKWGAAPDELLYAAAPPTIKFALGENPKQANWGAEATNRYPQTRAGVEEVIRTSFASARDYQRGMEEFKQGKRPYPPRRDLQQEAVLEILEGKRMIHSHCYRQDEILMLMRVAEEFGIKVHTFQHVLEGYKVADEMATHGAGGSAFSDWWAYKFEVYDAIPHNGYLMWDRGVTVSYNSDSDELARRLNTEAAKAVKYGGVPEHEALAFVTINPAKQLKVEGRVGSLETGKDADFSVWDGSPLSPYAHCEQTWIEGRKFFDREQDLAGREALARERAALIDLARRGKSKGAGGGGERRAGPHYHYLEDADRGGNECGAEMSPFQSEAEREAGRSGGER